MTFHVEFVYECDDPKHNPFHTKVIRLTQKDLSPVRQTFEKKGWTSESTSSQDIRHYCPPCSEARRNNPQRELPIPYPAKLRLVHDKARKINPFREE